ncbi:hypothetical protein KFL_005180040 [Klebsormidium nitens]|uniref:Uncharacterized protein n=1 Tax=Klebsormidium nitens TaxID=105231 RepID=A0A1Y1IEP1_KLENI|nr:hypothetical protein KFL_005180040 [Klebsormidium nitens]|eukprot:GAQ89404.1 hypothetical protein KFL_005180040 [Klebsormidium nitens]
MVLLAIGSSLILATSVVTFQWADGRPHRIQAVSQQGPPVFSGRGIDTVETAPFQILLQFNGTGKYFFNDPNDPELTVGIITVQSAGSRLPIINWQANTNYTAAVWNSTKGTGDGADPAPTPGPSATATPKPYPVETAGRLPGKTTASAPEGPAGRYKKVPSM